MSDLAIRVEGLSKRYSIGKRQASHGTLRESLTEAFTAPFRRVRGNGSSIRNSQSQIRNSDSPLPSTPLPNDDHFWALRDVSFDVKRGEVVGIIGRNGAGKSTLLKILSRITEPSEGGVDLHGRVGSLLEVGTGFHPELTGRENIFLNGAILGMRRAEIERKFDEIVAFAEIEKFLDTPVKYYSSGMYVRLAFAVAAHLEPEILIIDEVLAVGDAQFQKKCLGKIGDVAKDGRTVLFVSHNMVAVQTLCRRGLWLDAGHLNAQGAVSDIVTSYLRSGSAETKAAEQIWLDIATAPGNQTARLHRLSISPEGGIPGDPITMQSLLSIEVDYWNLQPTVHLHATLQVYNDQGIIAFTTSAGFDPDPVLHAEPPAGLFRSVCSIPANLLNSGSYRIALSLIRGNIGASYRMDDAIEFEVVDNSERKFDWFGKEPGVLRPKLHWDTKYLGAIKGPLPATNCQAQQASIVE